MILSDRDIKKQIAAGRIKLQPAADLKTQLGAASLDLRLSSKFRVFRPASTPYIDPQDARTFDELTEPVDVIAAKPRRSQDPRAFVVHPDEFVLGLTKESVTLPDDIVARIDGRSSLGRLGIIIHSTAGHIDPGFSGNITLEITNIGRAPVLLYPDMRIAQLVFETMSSPAEVSYARKRGAKYAGMTEPGASRISDESKRKQVRKGLGRITKPKQPKAR